MTDPTNLRARAEALLLADKVACGRQAFDEDIGDMTWADAREKVLRDAPAIIRDLLAALPPACACDGGLLSTTGDHAIGCPARPPEAPGERQPVAGWVDRGEFYELVLIGTPCCRVLTRAWNDGGWSIVSVTTAMAVTATIRNGRGDISLTGAQLAAEDAADALLCAGRRALGRVA